MAAFFESIEGKIILGLAIIILILSGLGFWYFHYSQNQISTLNQNNAKLQTSLTIDEKTIAAQTAFAKIQSNQISSLQTVEQQAASDAAKAKASIITPQTITTTTNTADLQSQLNKESSELFNDVEAMSIITHPELSK
jgi:hypothetical protein